MSGKRTQLTARQAEWLAAFRRQSAVDTAATARAFGVRTGSAWDAYHALRSRGYALPPLAGGRRVRYGTVRDDRAGPADDERAEHARRLEIVRAVRAEFWGSGRPWTVEQYHARLDEKLGDLAGVTIDRRRGA